MWKTTTAAALASLLITTSVRAADTRRASASPGSALTVEAVTALYQDRAGFLWVGSREGLAAFDGYAATVFEHDVADPFSIADNAIRVVLEDSRGRLWIGTNTGGLNVLDRSTGRFRAFRHDSADANSIGSDSVYAIAEDMAGRIWVGTQGGLGRLDPGSGAFTRFTARDGGLSHDYVDALLVDADGTVWIGTVGGGLNRLDPGTGEFTVYRHGVPGDGTPSSDEVFALAVDASGMLWVAGNAGVDAVDRASGRATPVPFEGTRPGGPLVTSIASAPDGTIWAGTFDRGLWALRPGSEAFRREPLRAVSDLEPADRVICVLVDQAGTTWAGTWGGGLARAGAKGALGTLDLAAGSDADTTAVHEDRGGSVWIGQSDVVIHRDPQGRLRSFPVAGDPLAFLERASDAMVVGSSAGLTELNPQTGALTFRPTTTGPRASREVGPGWIWSVAEDVRHDLWVAAGGGGVSKLSADGTVTRFRHDAADPRSLSDDYVIALLIARDGTLWAGTRSGGLNAMRPGRPGFDRYAPSDADPASLSHHSVTSLVQDRAGSIWVGTGGGGIDRVVADSSGAVRFEHVTEEDGLIDDNVVSLVEDDDGSLWVGTRRGLSRFDPATKAIASYGPDDGLPSAEFANGAAAAGARSLYFGTHRGVVEIPRGTRFPLRQPSPTVLTGIRTLATPTAMAGVAWQPERLEIAHGETLTFEIAVLDFGDRRRHRYAYKLDGLSKDWVDLGTRRDVTLSHLAPGAYTLRVRGRNDQGVWSEARRALPLRIVPPFWMTAWFRMLAAAGLLGLIVAGHRLRTAALERRNRKLVVLKEEREHALHEARASQSELHLAYGRLRGLTRRLEAAKEEERKRIARELHDEMGQILTTAKLNLQLIPGTQAPEDRERRVGDAIGLLDRLIGHVRALSLDLRPPLLDELGLTAALRGYVEAQARRSGIAIELTCDPVPLGLGSDVEIAAFRMVQEAITNVLRHAGAKRVAVELRYDSVRLELGVTDDGRGFDVAKALEAAAEGRHLGLLGMKERVESMGGTTTIESMPGRGSTVRASIPWTV